MNGGKEMEDREIIGLYWQRNEKAIEETQLKYGSFLNKIAFSVLSRTEDCEEAVNDTYFRTWNAIPSDRPEIFSSYLAKIVRRLSIDIYRRISAEKRGKSEYTISLDELGDCITDGKDPASESEMHQLTDTINRYLENLHPTHRDIFIRRYFYMESVKEISDQMELTPGNVKTVLSRTREKLKKYLIKEGY